MARTVAFYGQVLVRTSSGKIAKVKARKISMETLSIESDYPAEKQAKLHVTFSVLAGDKSKKIEATVEVLNSTYSGSKGKYRVELRFDDFVGDAEDYLERYIGSRPISVQ